MPKIPTAGNQKLLLALMDYQKIIAFDMAEVPTSMISFSMALPSTLKPTILKKTPPTLPDFGITTNTATVSLLNYPASNTPYLIILTN